MVSVNKSAHSAGRSAIGISLLALSVAQVRAQDAGAQSANPSSAEQQSSIADIVVTAQKRAQSINDVGMSIAAFSGDQLLEQGVTNIAELAKVVPGLTVQQTPFGAPAYSLRGVGFYESSLGAAPAVSVYVDQVGIPYASLSRLVAFDLERVEVLKGPQGTLFGQNATGGAINFIAAKPTSTFDAGMSLGYGRFEAFTGEGFVSGPLGDNLEARAAVKFVRSGDWQKSYTRSDSLGSQDQLMGRLLLDWTPSDRLKISLAASAWQDKSDTEAGQLIAITPQVPAGLDPRIAAYPLAPHTPRAADWTPNRNLQRDDRHVLLSGRADLELSDALTLTSITAYQRYKSRMGRDGDAISLQDSDIDGTGKVDSFSQELRLSGKADRFNWIVGGNFTRDTIDENFILDFTNSSNSTIPGFAKFDFAEAYSTQKVKAFGIFAHAEYDILPDLTAIGGIRYNDTRNRFVGGNRDVDGKVAPFFNFLSSALCGCTTNTPIVQGGDYLLIPSNHFQAGPVFDRLNEDNISYNAGLNWKPNPGLLLYATVSKGYKAGSFPTQSGASADQLSPAVQESVMAYEAGAKATFWDRRAQFNLAVFQYDYRNKQVRAKKIDPIFGVVEKLINVPKSRIRGVEAQLSVVPVDALTLSVSGNHLDAKVRFFPDNIDPFGTVSDAAGTRLPYTPKWQFNVDGQYDFPLSGGLDGFVGASVTHNGATNGGVGEPALTRIKGYTLLDLRAGISAADKSWRLLFWGKNVINSYYWTNATRVNDTTFRYAGRPVTFGATLSMDFH